MTSSSTGSLESARGRSILRPVRGRAATLAAAMLAGAVATLAIVPPAAPAQDTTHPRAMSLPDPGFVRPDPDDYRLFLDNGLVAYVAEDHTVPLVTLSAYIAVGTADGDREGAAEVLLESLRQGPSAMAADAFDQALEQMVADFSVSMSAEETEITLNVPREDAGEALRLLAGILREPKLVDPAVAANRVGVGATSTARAGSESPGGESGPAMYEGSLDGATRAFKERLLGGHPYGHRPTSDEIAALTSDDIVELHRQFFVPGNVVLAAAGDFDPAWMRSEIMSELGGWAGGPPPEPRLFDPITTAPPRKIHTYDVDKLQAWVVMGHELPRVPDDDQAALEVMNYILGGGHFDTRLFRVTRDRRGLTNDDSGFLEPSLRGPGAYDFRTYGRPEVVRLLIELTLAEIDRIRERPVTEEELLVAQGALAEGAWVMGFADANATVRTLAGEWLRYQDHTRSATYPDRIRAVTIEDVQAAARRYLHPERMIIAIVGPIDKVRSAPPLEGERALEELGTVVAGTREAESR